MNKKILVFFIFVMLFGIVACTSVSEPELTEPTPMPTESNVENSDIPNPEPTPIEPEPTPIEPEPTPIEPEPTPEPVYPIQDGLILMTLEQLARYDGREGRKAYIAVNGYIYDVTNSSRWPNGNHNGYQAGQDLTDAIMSISPHGIRVLDNIPKIGILVE
jgi:predicted heme/steroid binding protein